MNQYKELKDKQQERFNAFPMRFAFNDDQYCLAQIDKLLTKLGVESEA